MIGVAWAAAVWVALTLPLPPGAPAFAGWLPGAVEPFGDKLAHATLFLVQTLLVHRAWPGGIVRTRALVSAVLVAALYGGVTELGQRGVSGREADWADLAADGAGALLYASGWLAASRWRSARGRVELAQGGGGR
jgi:VanZ family protein